jgi:hypothetical protein
VPPTDISKIKLLDLPRTALFPLGRRTFVPDVVPAQSGPRWYQFSLRSLLAAMLVVAAFLAGRASITYRDALAPPLEGDWLIEFPGGAPDGRHSECRSRPVFIGQRWKSRRHLRVAQRPTRGRSTGR